MELGKKLAAAAEGVAYDLQATQLATLATKDSEKWWRNKLDFQPLSTYAAQCTGVVSPWSLEEVVLLKRQVFTRDELWSHLRETVEKISTHISKMEDALKGRAADYNGLKGQLTQTFRLFALSFSCKPSTIYSLSRAQFRGMLVAMQISPAHLPFSQCAHYLCA